MLITNGELVEPYNIVESQVKAGRFRWLDILMRRWCFLLESTLYDHLGVIVKMKPRAVEWMRFQEFHVTLTQRQPIYTFKTNYQGQGLFVIPNRFANACYQETSRQRLKPQPDKLPAINGKNHGQLYRVIAAMIKDFENSWLGLVPMQSKLTRITTHPARATIMHPFERCLIAPIQFRCYGFEADFFLCFPYLTLDKVLNQFKQSSLLAPENTSHYYQEVQDFFKGILDYNDYEVSAQLGKVELPMLNGSPCIKIGQVLPINSDIGTKVTLRLNDVKVLAGEIGVSQENYSVKVLQSYEDALEQYRHRMKRFQKVVWPTA